MDQFDLFAGLAAKEKAYAQLIANNDQWFREAMMVIIRLPKGWRGLGEDIRAIVFAAIGPPATSNNCYGPLIARAKGLKVLAKTGRRLPMKAPLSHGRVTDEYIRT